MHPTSYFPATSRRSGIYLLLALVASSAPSEAAFRTWQGSAGPAWSNPANWLGNVAPENGDFLFFPPGAANKINNNDIPTLNAEQIQINEGGYRLTGLPVSVEKGVTTAFISGSSRIDLDLSLVADAKIECADSRIALVINGDIDLANHTLSVNAVGDIALNGVISGSGGLVKTQSGTAELAGSTANTYTGETVVEDGVLELNKTDSVSVPGILRIGKDSGTIGGAIARHLNHDQCAADIIVEQTGIYDLNGFDETVLNITLYKGADIEGHPGQLKILESLTADPENVEDAVSRVDVPIDCGSGDTVAIDVSDTSFSAFAHGIELHLQRTISGSADLRKDGDGSVRLHTSNSFTGFFSVTDGTVAINHALAFGAPSGGVWLNGNATLQLAGVDVVDEMLVLNSGASGSGGNPAAFSAVGDCSWSGDISLVQDATLWVPDTLNLSGTIAGTRGLHLTSGSGTLTFSGSTANTYTGTTIVDGTLVLDKTGSNQAIASSIVIDGEVRLARDEQIANHRTIQVNTGGLLNLNGFMELLAIVSGTGAIDLGAGQLILTNHPYNEAFTGIISGTGNLIKNGTGTYRLLGENTYTGITRINQGVVQIDGSQPGSNVEVFAPGGLAGSGRTGAIICTGTIAPGSSPGRLQCGSVDMRSGSTFSVELAGPNPDTEHDQLDITGELTLDSTTLSVSLDYLPPLGAAFTIIENDGTDPVTGTFTGLANGSEFSMGGTTFRIDYDGGSGNDVVLTTTDVPVSDSLQLLSIEENGGMFHLRWDGGAPRYTVQRIDVLDGTGTWVDVVTGEAATEADVPISSSATLRFYRVIGWQ